ncbi:hypothetical protein A9Q74_14225 [Colwellia sp. 39_35_sub15_T18]|nr:hypothetical protein A9Q74_14225 [Colwellia sp. 39_35_sub15_T18]
MVVLITGAYGAIGKAACIAYAKTASLLFITGREQLKLDRLALQLQQEFNLPVEAIVTDVNNAEQIRALFQRLSKVSKRLDVLIHCAGILTQSPLLMTRIDEIQTCIATNLTSSILFCQQASKLMMRNKYGVITLVSSVVARQGSAGQSIYGAAKAGIEGLVKSLAKELGAVGIRINALAPGFIDTNLVKHFSAEEKSQVADKTCIGRIGQVDDITPVLQFLSSDGAKYITGEVIAVDGGLAL